MPWKAWREGEIKRLMVLMPPGHGKSVYCSVRFPSWYQHYPTTEDENLLAIKALIR